MEGESTDATTEADAVIDQEDTDVTMKDQVDAITERESVIEGECRWSQKRV
jgi:hypothetical protein